VTGLMCQLPSFSPHIYSLYLQAAVVARQLAAKDP
jgi:hypothetical protein